MKQKTTRYPLLVFATFMLFGCGCASWSTIDSSPSHMEYDPRMTFASESAEETWFWDRPFANRDLFVSVILPEKVTHDYDPYVFETESTGASWFWNRPWSPGAIRIASSHSIPSVRDTFAFLFVTESAEETAFWNRRIRKGAAFQSTKNEPTAGRLD